jgi:hypothetical protein
MLFHRSRTTQQFSRADEVIFPACENSQTQTPVINALGQTTGFDHVGYHHQSALPPVLQKISGRRAEAEGAEPPVGLRRKFGPIHNTAGSRRDPCQVFGRNTGRTERAEALAQRISSI